VKGHASAPDHHAALDLALDKVDHQLRKLHDRRTRKRNVRRNGAAPADNGDALDGMLAGALADETDGGDDGETIVKSKSFPLKPMEPEEAALQMNLLGHDFFLFTNAGNGRASVLYRRRDGNLGLIETTG
jgi:ribosome hibernation promoting factor